MNHILVKCSISFFLLLGTIFSCQYDFVILPLLTVIACIGGAALLLKKEMIFYYFIFFNFIIINKWERISLAEILLFLVAFLWFFSKETTFEKVGADQKKLFYSLLVPFLFSIFALSINFEHYTPRILGFVSRFVLRFFELLLGIYLVSKYWNTSQKTWNALNFIVIMGILQFPIATIEFAYKTSLYGYELARTGINGTFFTHHSYLAGVMSIVFYLSAGLLMITKDFRMKLLYIAGMCSTLITIMYSGARSVVVGMVASTALFLFANLRFNRKTVVVLLVTTITVIILYNFSPLGTMVDTTLAGDKSTGAAIDFSAASRILIWQGGWLHFINSDMVTKLFGTGIGTYNFIIYPFTLWEGKNFIPGAHNNPLHILCEMGVIGLVMFIIHFLIVLFMLRKKNNLRTAYFYLTIALLFSGISQETFWFQDAFPTFWLFYIVVLVLVLNYKVEDSKLCISQLASNEAKSE